MRPFENQSNRVVQKLIEKYNVVFPINLPYPISQYLQELIKDLTNKERSERLGYPEDASSCEWIEDIRSHSFFKN